MEPAVILILVFKKFEFNLNLEKQNQLKFLNRNTTFLSKLEFQVLKWAGGKVISRIDLLNSPIIEVWFFSIEIRYLLTTL